jgi:tryptophan synthase beta chain
MTATKITLPESDIPTHFYNIVPDLRTAPPPPLHPGTREPIGPDLLAPIFPMELIAQEVSQASAIEIPEEVREIYRLYRPSPLFRARAFEAVLDTPAHIYYKAEFVSPVGSHKLNTALVQAYANKRERVKRLATETGAGQWGSALACACQLMGLECMVYMVRISYEQKPYRRIMMKTYGADVIASPSNLTEAAGFLPSIPTRPEAWVSPYPRRSKTRSSGTTPSTRLAASSTMCCSTRPSSVRKRRNRWSSPASIPIW